MEYKHYQVVDCGFKYNMMDLQAAIGLHQLGRVEPYWNRRAEIWNRYNDAFAGLEITLPPEIEPGTRHAYHLYTILIDESRTGVSRDEFLARMTSESIGVRNNFV